jgi:exopolyphosphatase/guanosine-5'-triphosphate,3'-diphosphate pyrophosphatase
LRYAAIDIGSNAVRLLIADIIENDTKISFKKNSLIRVPLRLGDDAFLDKMLSPKKADDLAKTMLAFRHLMDVYKVEDYMACATSAMRESKNGPEVIKYIKDFANIDIQIVEGKIEASIIYSSNIDTHIDIKKNYLFVDVGGGSTELSFFSDGKPVLSHSFNIGTIRILDNLDKAETWEEMKEWIKQHSREFKNLCAIGTGGNINKLFRMSEVKEDTPLSFTALRNLYNYLNSFSLKDRINVLGLNQDRADVIIPAAEIYMAVMKWGGIKQILVPRVGMVDGIIQLLIENNTSREPVK